MIWSIESHVGTTLKTHLLWDLMLIWCCSTLILIETIQAHCCWTVWRSTYQRQPRTTVRQSTYTFSPLTTLPSTSTRTGTSGSTTTYPTTTPYEASSKMDSHMCSTSTEVIHPGQYYILFWKQENTSLTHCYFISSGPCLSRCCRRKSKSKCCIVSFSLTSCPTDYIQHIGSTLASLSPCYIPQRLYRQAQSLLRSLLPWSNIASKTGIQYSRTMWHSMVGGAFGATCHPH